MKREKKKQSVIHRTVHYMVIQILLLSVMLLGYIGYSYITTKKTQKIATKNLVEIFGQELNNKIKSADTLLEQMIYKNENYAMLQSLRESDRHYALVALGNMLKEAVTYNKDVDAFVIAEGMYQKTVDYENMDMTLQEREVLKEHTLAQTFLPRQKAGWRIETIGGQTYLYKGYVWQKRAAFVYILVENFLGNTKKDEVKDTQFLLVEGKNKKVWGTYGENFVPIKIGQQKKNISDNQAEEIFVLTQKEYRVEAYISKVSVMGRVESGMLVFFVIIFSLLIFTLFMVNYIQKEMIRPIGSMQKSMELIQRGDYHLRMEDTFTSREFSLLKSAFNRLMDEIWGLKIQTYEKQIVLQEAELKSIKLQIRPHFFLNAMTTISSLSQQGKNEKIRLYIDALSKNIRYMFRSGLHTVSLEEEVKHVENYFEMQELKYPGCVFYFIDIEEASRQWRIPQMLVHTIIENEYKYAVSVDAMLTILIKASLVEKEGEQFLLLEIEDDGKGYPVDVLNAFAGKKADVLEDGKRIGLWSIKRMLEIMYEREDLFCISNVEPHGSKNTFFIPIQAKQEVKSQSVIRID